MVYTEPKIEDFINFSKNLFNTEKINNTGNIYFIKYKENNFKLYPSHIHNLYKTLVRDHVDGKIMANTVIVGKDAVIKGDLLFRSTLKTEEGADIDGYIKRDANGKSKSEEDIDIEQIIQRPGPIKSKKKPKLVPEPHKEAV